MFSRSPYLFFLLCVCFSFVPPVAVLVLVPISSRDASFFFTSFPPPVEAPLPRPERCVLLLWLLELSADGNVSSSSCRSLNRDSSLSQINTDTPAGQRETAFISCPPLSAPDPGASPWCCWGTHPSQSQSHHPENWIYWSVNKYLGCVKDSLDPPIKVKGYQCRSYIHHSLTAKGN